MSRTRKIVTKRPTYCVVRGCKSGKKPKHFKWIAKVTNVIQEADGTITPPKAIARVRAGICDDCYQETKQTRIDEGLQKRAKKQEVA